MEKNTQLYNQLIEKLKKLIRLRDSAEKIGSTSEAINAAQKIQNLLLKYNLDLSELNFEEQQLPFITSQLIAAGDWVTEKVSDGMWVYKLSSIIAKFNMCRSISDMERKIIIINGIKENCIMVSTTLEFLVPELKAIAHNEFRKAIESFHEREGDSVSLFDILVGDYAPLPIATTFYPNFYRGALHGIYDALEENQERFVKENNCHGLMITNSAALDKYMKHAFPNLKNAPPLNKEEESLAGYIAWMKGMDAGKKIFENRKKLGDE